MTVRELGGYALAPGEGRALWFLGGLVTFKARAHETGGEIEVIEQSGRAGMGPPVHSHAREAEAFYVIDGEMTFLVGDETVAASAGSFVFVPRKAKHAFRVDSTTAKFLLVVTPAVIAPFFEELGEPAPAAVLPPPEKGPPDAVRFDEIARKYGQEVYGPPITSARR